MISLVDKYFSTKIVVISKIHTLFFYIFASLSRQTMNISKKKIENNHIKLIVKIVKNDYGTKVQESLKDYQKKMNLPGFRVGKVPMSIVKSKYELAIRAEEINKILSSTIDEYIKKNQINILGNPLPIENKVDFIKDSDYTFEFELGIQPNVDLSKLEKSKVNFYDIKVSNDKVTEYINSVQKRFGNIKSFEKITLDDMLSVEMLQIVKKDSTEPIKVNTSFLVNKIEDNTIKKSFLKLKKTNSIEFDIQKAFSNHADVASMLKISKENAESLSGKFLCTINDISRLVPAELDEDLFKKVYPSKLIKNKKEFTKEIADEISNNYSKDSDRKFFNDCSTLFVDKSSIDFPEKFLKKWLKKNLKKQLSEEEFNDEYKNYLKYLSWQLIENEICTQNNIKVTNQMLKDFTKAYVLKQMKSYGNIQMGNKEIDGIVENVLKNQKESEKMMNEVIMIELTSYFKKKIKTNKKTVTLNEFIKLANKQS